jgi:L-asparagine transporter-like permease
MMQALAELTVLYPINGAFCMYICRFVDPSLGFACAWEYAISWLTVLRDLGGLQHRKRYEKKDAWEDHGLT